MGLVPQALLMPKIFDAAKVREAVRIVERLSDASFRNVSKETARSGIIKDHKTLRVHLDLLVAGEVLDVM